MSFFPRIRKVWTSPLSRPFTSTFRCPIRASCQCSETLVCGTWQRKAYSTISCSLGRSSKHLWWSGIPWQKIQTETGSHWSGAKRAIYPAGRWCEEGEWAEKPREAGQMMRTASPDDACLWSKVVQSLPAEQMNAAVDTLPHNANLHLWKKKSDCCPLCRERQTLIHTLK